MKKVQSKTTIYEIAKKAGVSIATVSRAINPETQSRVAPETLRHILEIIKQNHYTPSIAARNLTANAYKTIGMVFPHHAGIFRQDYYTRVLSGAADAIVETDYQLKLMMLRCGNNRYDKYDFHRGDTVDGILVSHWRSFFSSNAALRRLNVPAVIINDVDPEVPALFVAGDHEMGGRLAAEYLFGKGHRKIGVLTGSPDSRDGQLRLKGFRRFLKGRNVEIKSAAIACGHFQEKLAFEMTPDFLKKNPGLTAVFCCNDGMAFGLIRAMGELGLKCPKDLSVIGYDDETRCDKTAPALTSVRVPLEDLANEAARRLVAHLRDRRKGKLAGTVLQPVTLIERSSVRTVK